MARALRSLRARPHGRVGLPRRHRLSDPRIRAPGPGAVGQRSRRCGRARSSGRPTRKLPPKESGPAPRLRMALESDAARFEDRAAHAGPLWSWCRLVGLAGQLTWKSTWWTRPSPTMAHGSEADYRAAAPTDRSRPGGKSSGLLGRGGTGRSLAMEQRSTGTLCMAV